jgi:hypothetical protein
VGSSGGFLEEPRRLASEPYLHGRFQMRIRPGWIRTGIALGVTGALLVVSPALGGPSLQSLVKKEVAKQYAAAQVSKKKKKPVQFKTTVVQRTGSTGPIASGAAGDGVASCVGNEKAVGGGFAAASGFGRIDGSQPELSGGVPRGWHVFVGNDSPGSATFTVYVLCQTP